MNGCRIRSVGRGRSPYGRLGTQEPENGLDIEVEPCFQGVLAHKVDVEDQTAGVAIGQVVVTDRRHRNVQLSGVDAAAEYARFDATVEYALQHRDEIVMQFPESFGLLQMSCLVQVLAVHERHELRVLQVVVPRMR